MYLIASIAFITLGIMAFVSAVVTIAADAMYYGFSPILLITLLMPTALVVSGLILKSLHTRAVDTGPKLNLTTGIRLIGMLSICLGIPLLLREGGALLMAANLLADMPVREFVIRFLAMPIAMIVQGIALILFSQPLARFLTATTDPVNR